MSGGPAAGSPQVAPPPTPADVGLVAALPIEVAPLLAKLREPRKFASARATIVEGFLGEKLVAAIVTGPGQAAGRRGTALLIDGHHPHTLLSVGFAGALARDWKRNRVVVVRELVDRAGSVIHTGLQITAQSPAGLDCCGRLVTVDDLVRTASDKASLRAQTGADLVDMESFAVASVCLERGVRFASVRVISDEAEVDLPPEILALVGPTGGYRVGAALGAIWKRPAAVKELLALREHARQAAERLAETVPKLVSQLT